MSNQILTALVAAENGEIFDLEGYAAVGMSGNRLHVLEKETSVVMPHGSELMLLPDRKPILFNLETQNFETVEFNPYDPDEKIFPVAVFNSPGYVNRHFAAYEDDDQKDLLPLFSYGAVGFGENNFRSAALQVDKEPRQDLRQMPQKKIVKGVRQMRKQYPDNRLMRHLETCALEYGCPAGKNFFLKRYEAPLPTSTVCNARCLGCISLQTENNLCACQERISFNPSATEIAQVALEHINYLPGGVVSFGQGCEGEPLTAISSIEPAVRMIREQTDKGTINLNTNAGLPDHVKRLCNAGLDAMRVSMNSIRKDHYTAYFRPKSYKFEDVMESIRIARSNNIFVAVNYLNCPGFTDSEAEFDALKTFIQEFDINMIQWRNLNFDPRHYIRVMANVGDSGEALGMDFIISELSSQFPDLRHGYFNPPVR